MMEGISILAVLVAAASAFAVGGLWYSPALFGKLWNRENGGQPQQGHPAKVFGVSFVMALIAATAFAVWLGPDPELGAAVRQGLLVGLCFVATSYGINYQFAQRSTLLWAIDGGYHVAQFVLFGVVLGLWG